MGKAKSRFAGAGLSVLLSVSFLLPFSSAYANSRSSTACDTGWPCIIVGCLVLVSAAAAKRKEKKNTFKPGKDLIRFLYFYRAHVTNQARASEMEAQSLSILAGAVEARRVVPVLSPTQSLPGFPGATIQVASVQSGFYARPSKRLGVPLSSWRMSLQYEIALSWR